MELLRNSKDKRARKLTKKRVRNENKHILFFTNSTFVVGHTSPFKAKARGTQWYHSGVEESRSLRGMQKSQLTVGVS